MVSYLYSGHLPVGLYLGRGSLLLVDPLFHFRQCHDPEHMDIHQRQHTNAANDQHLDALNITLLTLQRTQKNSNINGVVSRWSRSVQN